MNVLEEDRPKAQALHMTIGYCLGKVYEHTKKGHETGNINEYREAKKWSFELRDAQVELDELFLRKEEVDKQHVRVFGRVYR